MAMGITKEDIQTIRDARNNTLNSKKKKKLSKRVKYNGRMVSRGYYEQQMAKRTKMQKQASDHNKAWQKARKEGKLKEFEDKHRTKKAEAIYKSASEKSDKWKKENKRGKYSDQAKAKKKAKTEETFGKGWKRNLGRIKRWGSFNLLQSKDAKQYGKDKKSNKLKIQKKKKKAINLIKSRLN